MVRRARPLLLGVQCAAAVAADAAPATDPSYAALNVWPMPTSVTLPSAPAGPHAVPASVAFDVGADCGADVRALAGQAVGLATTYRGNPRTYDEGPYAAADAYCPAARRCGDDVQCNGTERCHVPSDRRWSSSRDCPPSAAYNTPCGCCAAPGALPAIGTLRVRCDAGAGTPEEGYSLNATADAIVVDASTPRGAAYGLATLSQLLRWDTAEATQVLAFIPLAVSDAPRYRWRGLMLDTSRHFVPVADILRTVDAMYAAKLNPFHWHIVDAPSWPYGSAQYPELAREGSWDGTNRTVYSQEDVARVSQYAKSRFVDLVLEIDTPAHTLAMAKSHPEMMTPCWEWMAKSRYKVDVDSDDCMALDPTNAQARELVANVLAEVAGLEGGSQWVHIGGDEVKYPCWNSSAAIRASVAATYGDLSSASFARLQAEWTANVSAAAVTRAGKTPVLWQPTAKGPGDPAWDDALPKDAVYMVWLNSASAKAYAEAGKDVVYTTPFYVAGMGSGGWTKVYNAEIMPRGLTAAQERHILGAEVCLWGESLDAGNLGVRALQISMAAAENFWRDHDTAKGPGAAAGLGVSDRYNRFLCHLRRFGVDAPPIMPSHCEAISASL